MAKRIATTIIPFTEMEVAGPYNAANGQGNYDESRANIDRVIIHTMVGTAASAAARFDNPTSNVSAHYGVKLDGGLVHWLEEYFTAYHSGDYAMNQRSIGIEHEDNGDYNGVRTDALYTTSAKLVRDICQFYGIPIDRQHILKHSEVHPTGCPDALDIDRIVREAQGQPMATITQTELDQMRHDRDQNYNYFKTLVEFVGVKFNDADKEKTKDETIAKIKEFQARPTVTYVNVPATTTTGTPTTTQPIVSPSTTTTTVPAGGTTTTQPVTTGQTVAQKKTAKKIIELLKKLFNIG